MTSDELAALADFSIDALTEVVDADWSTRAGVLEWSCWQTVDHMVDCLFSYAMQIGRERSPDTSRSKNCTQSWKRRHWTSYPVYGR